LDIKAEQLELLFSYRSSKIMKSDSWFSFLCGYCILVCTGMYKICSIL